MSTVSSQSAGSSRGGRSVSWEKLVAMLLSLLAVSVACTINEPIRESTSNCFVRASNSLWSQRNITAQTFLPPKCPVILPQGQPNPFEAYDIDFFAPEGQVSVFTSVDVTHITPTGIMMGTIRFTFFGVSATLRANAKGTYVAGFSGFFPGTPPVDTLVATVPLNDGQVARGVADLQYQPGTAVLGAPGGNVGVPATASVSNIVDLPGPYTFEWFLDEVSLGSTGSQSWTTYTVNSYGTHRVDALVQGANGLSIFLSQTPFFNDGDPGDTCIICDDPPGN